MIQDTPTRLLESPRASGTSSKILWASSRSAVYIPHDPNIKNLWSQITFETSKWTPDSKKTTLIYSRTPETSSFSPKLSIPLRSIRSSKRDTEHCSFHAPNSSFLRNSSSFPGSPSDSSMTSEKPLKIPRTPSRMP